MTTAAATLTAAATAIRTFYCPACEQYPPADAFLAHAQPGDTFGAALCCRACLLADLAAERVLQAHRQEVRRDPRSPLARACASTRAHRGEVLRAVARYAQGLTQTYAAA